MEALVAKLQSFAVDPNQTLWHYTNGSALLAIINSGTIFSTQVSCLNDSTEVRYASKLFCAALESLRALYLGDSIASAFLDRAIDLFQEDIDDPSQSAIPYFVTCFTELEDDLSQWRAYGGGENGYALGFKASDLFGVSQSIVVKVNYDQSLHVRLAEETAKATVTYYIAGLNEDGGRDPDAWADEFLFVWNELITRIAPLVKDPGFESEQEYRIVKQFTPGDVGQLHFLQKNSLMSRHLPLQLPSGMAASGSGYRLPISSIMVGPCRHRHVSRASIGSLLLQKFYAMNMVSVSRSPFQVT
jgi:hypothetical protein